MAKTTIKEIKNDMKGKTGFKTSTLVFALLALIITVALFFGLIILQNYLSEDIIYTDVIVAKVDIPKGVILTTENAQNYLERRQVNSLTVPRGTISDPMAIMGQRNIVPLIAGEMLSVKDFENLNKYLDGIVDPVEISIAAPYAANTDGGKIRAGDLINITMMFSDSQLGRASSKSSAFETQDMFSYANDVVRGTEPELHDFQEIEGEDDEEGTTTYYNEKSGSIIKRYDNYTKSSQYHFEMWAQYVMDGLYVKEVLNSEGQVIAPDDKDSIVSMFIFIIPKADERDLNNILANCGGMRISKNVTIPDYALNEVPNDPNAPTQETPVTEEVPETTEPVATPTPGPTEEEIRAQEDAEFTTQGYFKVTILDDGAYADEEGKEYQIGETEDGQAFVDADGNAYVIGIMRDATEKEKAYALIIEKSAYDALLEGNGNEETEESSSEQ